MVPKERKIYLGWRVWHSRRRPWHQRGPFAEAITPRTGSRFASTSRKQQRGGSLRLRFPGGARASLEGRWTEKHAYRIDAIGITLVQRKSTLLPHSLDKHVHGTLLRSPISSSSQESEEKAHKHVPCDTRWHTVSLLLEIESDRHSRGAIWALVFMVSSGCPTSTCAAPPTLPAMSSLTVLRSAMPAGRR